MTRAYDQTSAPRRLAAVLLALLIVLPGLAAAAPDWRRSAQEQLEPNTLVRPPGISLEQAANKVRRQTGGRVLSASPTERSGQRGYEVRVLLEGKRVKNYFVDADGRVRSRD
ncbi:MAG: PepSY domain-containing protein [Gammaproteobacteria bacterium]|nr:PepSY domain-containing protein [Gammaproteobacteria bacterium]